MFRNYRFTDDTRDALANARSEAHALGHDFVGPEHILLGLWGVEGARAVAALRLLGVEEVAVRQELQRMVRPGTGPERPGELPYTSRAKKVLELAMAEARDGREAEVDTPQLLLGIVREKQSPAALVLAELGVRVERVRDAVARVQWGDVASPPPSPEAAVGQSDVWYLEIDAAAGTPIYEQIIARIEEAVATGQLAPGERLPSVRDLAAELGIAPGTVARAYSSLEQRGVVRTERGRGTSVAEAPAGARVPRPTDGLERLLRRIAVAAFHRGASAQHVRDALERAMSGILRVL